MALESASFIDDLVITNPVNSDDKRQGDDHLRLIKTVLKACFPRAGKAFRFPTTVAKSANYTVLSSDDNTTFVCNTATAFSLTLPTLTVDHAGWAIYVLKTTTDANPVFIVPPSGTINGYTKVRRSIENQLTKVLWTGSVFIATRPNGGVVGTVIPFHGSTLPNGYLWPDGLTFTAADYVELNAVLGTNTKPDRRGRSGFGKDNMGGIAAGRLTTEIEGTTLGAVGGSQSHQLTQAQIPGYELNLGSLTPGTIVTGVTLNKSSQDVAPGAGLTFLTASSSITVTTAAFGGTLLSGGGGTSHNNVPPAIIQNELLVAE